MILNSKNYILFVLLIIVNYTYSQKQLITTPGIASPERKILSIFSKDKIDNPIFLNGAVKEVTKKIIVHLIPTRTHRTENNYQYNLNKQKEVTHYASDKEFDGITAEFLNIEKNIVIKGDTLIDHHTNWYAFKNGKILIKKEKIYQLDRYTDSISFNYLNNKLTEIEHYNKEVATKINETGERSLVIDNDYKKKGYGLGTYNENDLLVAKLYIEDLQDIVITSNTTYQYNTKKQLIHFEKVSEEHGILFFDWSNYHKNKITPQKSLKKTVYNIMYIYDINDRLIKLEADVNSKQKHIYNIRYHKNKRTVTFTNKGKIIKEIQYVFDKNNNPVEEKKYVYIDGKKHLDTSIRLDIKYY